MCKGHNRDCMVYSLSSGIALMARTNKRKSSTVLNNRIIPAVLAALAVSILIFILYYVNFDVLYGIGASAVLFASFGASAFILFLTPRAKSARLKSFVESYVVGAFIGALGFYLSAILPLYVVAGIIVFLLSSLMIVADAPHPPAIGIALAFVLYKIDVYGIFIVILGLVILLFLRVVLERFVFVVERDVERLEEDVARVMEK